MALPFLFVVNLKNLSFIFTPPTNHILPVISLCILMFTLPETIGILIAHTQRKTSWNPSTIMTKVKICYHSS